MLINWVAALEPLTRKGWYWGMDGKIKMSVQAQPHDIPWMYNPVRIEGLADLGCDCGLLTNFHNLVFQKNAAHSFCMECYKVVVVPETLAQVHKIAEWQGSLKFACKVGAERRSYVQRKWGAYFYCRGIEEGRERYKMVREWVDENLGKDIKVFLKRACTEFEQNMGDSDKWENFPRQDELEAEGHGLFDVKAAPPKQGDCVIHHVWDVWDDWDKRNKSPITYHEEE